MSAPITGQTITFEQISETLRTQYSDAEKRLQDSSKTQVDPMRLNKNPKSLDNDIRARLENKPMLAPPAIQVSDSDNATTAKTNDARLTMILGNLTGIADQDITTRLHNNLESTLLRHEMAHNKFRELSDAYSSSLDDAQKADDIMHQANNNYNAVDKKVQSLEKKVNTLNQELSQLQPGDPQYNKVLTQKNAAEKTLTLSLQKKSLAEKSLNTAIMDADAAIGQSMEIFDEIQQQEQINNFTTNICLTQENQKNRNATATFILLITSVMEVIGDTNCDSIKNQSEVMKEINHVRENKLNETARKYTTTTKVLKIVNECVTVATIAMSAILIVVGLLAAVPSGGSSIAGALALIGGIAGAVVLGVDITCQIALGTTATGWILGKVVEGLSAAIKTVDPTLLAITALLDVIGVDQDTIELVKSIYASAAASLIMATVMIGAAVICSVAIGAVVSALSKTAAEEVTKEITGTIKSTIESIINSVSKNIIKVLDSVCSMIQTSVVVLKLIAKISNGLEKIGLLICETATSIMNYCVAENSADMAILQQDMSNLSKTREQMLSVLQRVDKTVEQEVSQMVRVLQHRTEALKFASHSIV
ncbi:TPA: YopB/SseC family type III secretion system translocon subunit [Escherichia coli]|uniref:YopB/SseC family type III secretion system translocon subunit n=1 Tax=Escherichia coli TaxID=562 RepID=A0A7L7EE58_ECOLX|nr:YopB/SseC family type III secretion system translocon subunit [Escherichia coli]EES0673632.1 YopB/SseC family type III secretion system translocon subunit [Escherichia coli]EEU3605974.1 YopB/SseC family type III secretion system translocon subunit [Escherichia coli]EEW1719933.1 type III cell invasion protein SipB [Escherichia coli]EEZ2197855.1 YopB/SseC family type III secretion system translocon subunit [Escherichia coli]EFC2504555.1 type III cell invasion protein SipB [Escherichia coli]